MKTENKTSTLEREILAVLRLIEYFKSFLENQDFELHIENSALQELSICKEIKDSLVG